MMLDESKRTEESTNTNLTHEIEEEEDDWFEPPKIHVHQLRSKTSNLNNTTTSWYKAQPKRLRLAQDCDLCGNRD